MSVKHIWFWTVLTFLFLFFLLINSESENVRKALVTFMHKLEPPDQNFAWGWNLTSDPCTHNWHGVTCSANNQYIKSIVLEELNLTGVLDATSLCISTSLQFVSLNNNNLHGFISEDIRNCKFLTHLLLSGNEFSGNLPVSISQLRNMKRLHVSDNRFTGNLPNMVNVTSLISFLAQNNKFTGQIPDFDFSNFEAFNVSNNDLRGPVPDVRGRFGADSFYGNPNLCGKPMSNSSCPPPPPPPPPIALITAGSQSGHSLDWRSRLDLATKIAEALAYMHEELGECGIAHGNLKSSNILISQGASEERMVNLLQVALKCTNPSPNDKLSMSQVALITNALKDEDDKSISYMSIPHHYKEGKVGTQVA